MINTASAYRKQFIKLSTVAGLLGSVAMTAVHAAPPAETPGRPFPEVKIPAHANGPRMIASLGSKLPEVARFYGFTEEEFRGLVEHDHSIHADLNGHIYHVCEGPEAGEAPSISEDTTNFQVTTASEAFNLSSLPGADLTIYLDFDGHTTSGTSWNSRTGGADFYTPAYDTNGNVSAFSSGELNNIFNIWKRVAEDYAPWEVNVTTVDPGVAALKKDSSNDTQYGIRVVIGGSSSDWYGTSAGGVAYLNSFSYGSDTPCYAFEAQLGNGNVKYTAEAISHEVGHTLSLYHDGVSGGTAYYQGHGDWAPIMGVGYYNPIVQWSKGEYANANNLEDDIAEITRFIPLRSDLIADDMNTTMVLGLTPIIGIIEDQFDADIFSFQTDGGAVDLSAQSAYEGNLDIRLGLYNGYGDLLASSDPSTLNASISTSLSAGTYYVMVEGYAPGNPNTAYSEYGSIGQYRLTGTFTTSQNQPPVAVASTTSPTTGRDQLTVSFSSAGSMDPDGTILTYDWNFGDGSSSSSLNPTHSYTTSGIFTASLVVVDDKGASSSDSVIITVTEPLAPVADTSRTTPTSGTAPLTVNLDGTRSSDPDGSISSYAWTTSNGQNFSGSQASYTFTQPGTYSVTLRVVDNEGLTDSESITITVNEPVALSPLFAVDLSVSVSGNSKKGYVAIASVSVIDENGRSVQGASVIGQFSGAVNETVSTNSGRRGDASFRSSKFRDNGNVTFVVTDILLDGFAYAAN